MLEIIVPSKTRLKLLINKLVEKAEKLIHRKIMYLNVTPEQMEQFFKESPSLLIWQKDE